MPYNSDDIIWADDIGTQENYGICTKEIRTWIKLSNGKASHVATVRVTINPFPQHGQPHLACSPDVLISAPCNLQSLAEQRAYGRAVYLAGVFAGKHEERASLVRG